MRLEHLQYFCEVARTESINEASKNLFMTQPALTAALNNLEKELGFRLLIRSHNGVRLTDSGRKLRDDCEKILAITSQWRLLAEREQFAHEPIHIAANPAAYHSVVTPIILAFDQHYKGMDIFSYEVKNQMIPSYIEKMAYALGILSVLSQDEAALEQLAKASGWKLDLLLEDYCQVLMSAKNPLAAAGKLRVADLAPLNLAMYPEKDDPIVIPLFKQYFQSGTFFHLSNLESILQMVVEDHAVAIMPGRMLARNGYVREGKIKLMALVDYPQPLNYYLLYRKKDLRSQWYKDAIRLIKQIFVQEMQLKTEETL